MISETFLVSVLMTTDMTFVRFGLTVGSLVASHRRRCVGAEATGVAHERSLVGVLEPHVLIQGRLLHSSVTTMGTMESHCSLLCVLP